ncbi:acyl carrier protein [Actinoplanes xinjiangensis]|uniref:acyl carrier protein n=1 Tax=Actinoplanes xinjiangensis TaxID=512350 RepID=UPI0034221357
MTDQVTKPALAAIQEWLLGTCRDLGLRATGPEDDFFETGGTSLTAIKLIAKVEERYGDGALPPDDLFTQSSMHGIAASIGRNATVTGTPGEPRA